MSDRAETQLFNLKVVVHETGLKPDTIRAWERRYGLPQPRRSSGGHRLYSRRDIEIIKWLMARQEEGLSISNAVDLWNSIEGDGQDPLISMQLSKDGARTWSNWFTTRMGKVGEYQTQAVYRRLGVAEQMTFKIRISAPVKKALTGSYLK